MENRRVLTVSLLIVYGDLHLVTIDKYIFKLFRKLFLNLDEFHENLILHNN